MTKGNISIVFPNSNDTNDHQTFKSFKLNLPKFEEAVPKIPSLLNSHQSPLGFDDNDDIDVSPSDLAESNVSSGSSSKNILEPTTKKFKPQFETCQSCNEEIVDKFLLHVNGKAWHTSCLRCSACMTHLGNQITCFVGKDDQLYCKADYNRYFGVRCAKCQRVVSSTDWVRRAKQLVYHLACFACNICHRQLSTGEEFALHDHHVLCRQHFMELLHIPGNSNNTNTNTNSGSSVSTSTAGQAGSGGNMAACGGIGGTGGVDGGSCDNLSVNGDAQDDLVGGSGGGSSSGDLDCVLGSPSLLHKSKRSRTTFSEDQLKVLQANFNMNSNPDGQDLERIASQTGLSKRVIQVWFQNARSRQKKHLSTGATQPGAGVPTGAPAATGTVGNNVNGAAGPLMPVVSGGGGAVYPNGGAAPKLHHSHPHHHHHHHPHHALSFGPQATPPNFDDVMSPNALTGGIM
ncbi:LIM/homeobox protein Lhx9-like isoform X2 [Convolutriloba macropyga]